MEYTLLEDSNSSINNYFIDKLKQSHPDISYSRLLVSYWFYKKMNKINTLHFKNVSIISGSINEPELKTITFDNLNNCSFDDDKKFDLDTDWSKTLSADFIGQSDLVICNQVLEHISNPVIAFKNFTSLLSPGGLLFVSVPVLNCIHGEPYFFSSGYHPRFLHRHATDNNLIFVDGAFWGTYKYAINAISGRWSTAEQLRPGFRSLSDLKNPLLSLTDGRNANSTFASLIGYKPNNFLMTDCWGLYKKN
jgi:SAM-dependent methyltransferase